MNIRFPVVLAKAASDSVGFRSYGFRTGVIILCLGGALYFFLRKRGDR